MATFNVETPTETNSNETDVIELNNTGELGETDTQDTGTENKGNVSQQTGAEGNTADKGNEDAKGDTDKKTDEGDNKQPTDDTGLKNNIDIQNKADNDAKKTLTDKNIDFDALSDEYVNNGNKLSNKTYEDLEKAGYPKTVVDAFIAGKQALVTQFSNSIIQHAGGQEGYAKLINAIKAKGADAVSAYNALIDEGNITAIKMVLDGVKGEVSTKAVQRNGTSNPTVLGGVSTATAGGYSSVDEMSNAMNDKRYGRDDSYTLDVQNKVAKSTFIKFGN